MTAVWIPQGSIVDEWAFVICNRRLGVYVADGPVTGRKWTVTMSGTWIDANDALELADKTETVFCFRTRTYIDINPVSLVGASPEQLKLIKE